MAHNQQQSDAEQFSNFSGMIGHSAVMQAIFQLIAQVAPTDMPVLIEGETGTGKELVARAIHQASGRAGSFVAVNCAAVVETLIESELFGHEKGAFTGACQRQIGLFEQAREGTLLLDEISEATSAFQAKLLRVLDSGVFERVGGQQLIRSDMRIICATNVRLDDVVRERRFRQDLYYRVSGFHVVLPPLRERVEDIPLLVTHFLQRFCAEQGKDTRGLTEEAMQKLLCYEWPGNVRELERCMEAAVIVCQTPLISSDHLHLDGQAECGIGTLHYYEREGILRVLQSCRGNKSRAARVLGISPNTLYIKLRQYGLLNPTTTNSV